MSLFENVKKNIPTQNWHTPNIGPSTRIIYLPQVISTWWGP
jgi:hypothetical protein